MDLTDLTKHFNVPDGDAFDVAPEAAISHFQAKGLKPTFAWQDMIGQEHAHSFTVAKMMDVDLLADVQASLRSALDDGVPFKEWADGLIPTLQAKGWWGRKQVLDPVTGQIVVAQLGSPHRLATIFRTNLQGAYAQGQWDLIEAQAEEAPFLLYDAIDDGRTRPEHRAWDGTLLPVTSTWWKTHTPPCGWNCRCSVIQLNEDEIEDLGLTPNERAPRFDTYEWTNPRTGQTFQIPRGVDPGFGQAAAQRIDNIQQLLAEKVAALPADLEPFAAQGVQATVSLADEAAAAHLELVKSIGQRNLARSQQKLAKLGAEIEIQNAQAEKVPYLAAALKKLITSGKTDGMGPVEILKQAKEQAAKQKQSAGLHEFKKAMLAEKKPSKLAQEAFDNLPGEAQASLVADLQAQLAAKQAEAAAKAKLDELLASTPTSAAGKAVAELKKAGALEGTAIEQLAKVEAKVAEVKAKANQVSLLSGYKAKVIAGKVPTEAQKAAFEALPEPEKQALLTKIEQAKGAATPPTAQPELTPQTGAPLTPSAPAFENSDLVQVGPQKGSNPGGLFQDTTTGERWYIKTPESEDVAKNELLAGKLYELAGIDVPELRLTTLNGKPSIASKFVDGLESDAAALKKGPPGVFDGFGVDAWLANWDAVGLKYDNMLLKAGKAIRIDVGGSLLYRAQGGLKGSDFGKVVNEIDTLRSAAKNEQAAAVFGKMTQQQVEASVARVLAIADDDIWRTVDRYGPGDAAARQALADLLVARKADLGRRFPHLTQAAAKARQEAVEQAQFAAQDGLQEINGAILTAIKGIASRAAKGAPLEAKDIERVSEAKKALAEWAGKHGKVLTAASLKNVRAYYDAWLSDLDEAVSAGTGSAAKWGGGQFDGLKAPVQIDPSKVTFKFPPAGTSFTQEQAKSVIAKSLGSNAASIDVPRGKGHEALADVPLEHKRAISAYTGSYYRKVNGALREGSASPEIVKYAELLSEALDLAPKYQGAVARGIALHGSDLQKFLDEHRQAMLDGSTVVHRGFISTTKGNVPAFDNNVWLHIESKAGVWVNPISLNPGRENEVLLKHRSRFTVQKIEQKGERWHVYMTEVDNG